MYGQTRRVHPLIKGEDVATVVLSTRDGTTIVCNMAYAGNHLEHDRFPETFVFVEGDKGSAEFGPDCWIRTTTVDGICAVVTSPPATTGPTPITP